MFLLYLVNVVLITMPDMKQESDVLVDMQYMIIVIY